MLIDIPTTSWLAKAEKKFHHSGIYNGYPELCLTFGAPRGARTSVPSKSEVFEILKVLSQVRVPKLKLAWIRGTFISNDDGMYFLVKSLRDYGFYVGAEVPASLGMQLWFPMLSWLQLWSTDPWIPIFPNELVYSPQSFPAPDIILPPKEDRSVICHINTALSSPTEQELFDFITQSEHAWSVL